MGLKSKQIRLGVSIAATLLLVALIAIASCAWDKLCGNRAITFYGRVVDPAGAGIPGVTIPVKVHYSNRLVLPVAFSGDEKTRELSIVSDRDGNFEFTTSGYSLWIGGFYRGGRELGWAYSPGDSRIPKQGVDYNDAASRASVPDSPTRRAVYPLSLSHR